MMCETKRFNVFRVTIIYYYNFKILRRHRLLQELGRSFEKRKRVLYEHFMEIYVKANQIRLK